MAKRTTEPKAKKSDLVATVSDGFVPDASEYQRVLKIMVPGRVSKAAQERRTLKGIQRLAVSAK